VLERQKIVNLFAFFFTRQPSSTTRVDPESGELIDVAGDDFAPITSIEPGSGHELSPGEDVKFSDPPDAGNTYEGFMRQQYQGAGSGVGIPYELLTGDLRNISDRAMRVMFNEFRQFCEQKQWQIIIPMFCARVRNEWVKYAVLSGQINPDEANEARDVIWSTPSWPYIHPVQDVQAKLLEFGGSIRSRSSIIAERGDDPDEVDMERLQDRQREIDFGLPDSELKNAPDSVSTRETEEPGSNAQESS